MQLLKKVWIYSRNLGWALIVAFMLGVQNFYKGEIKSKNDIVFQIEKETETIDDEPFA